MPVQGKLLLTALLTQTNPLDRGSGSFTPDIRFSNDFTSGIGANQADRLFTDDRQIAASGTEDLDVAGGLTDAFGATITMARVKAVFFQAALANINNVVIGAGTNPWLTALGATGTITLRPGAWFGLCAPDAVAYAVTAATGDILKVANSGAGTVVNYTVMILGASA